MLNVGIAGMGFIGRTHFEAIAKIPDARVTAVASGRAARLSDLPPSVERYDDYSRMVAEGRVDAVLVCVPTYLHEPYAVRALEAGRAVLCEKPFALDPGAAARMLAASRASGALLMVGQVLRFWPQYVRIKELVSAGAVGAVRAVTARRLSTRPAWGEWFADPAKSGGCLLDLQIHDLDLVSWLLGRPTSVSTRGVRSDAGAWDHVVTTLTFSGAVVHVEASWLLPPASPFTSYLRVDGTEGSLEYSFRVAGAVGRRGEAENRLLLYDAGGVSEVEAPGDDPFVALDRYFVGCVAAGAPPARCTPEESLAVMGLAAASLASAETGTRVSLRTNPRGEDSSQ